MNFKKGDPETLGVHAEEIGEHLWFGAWWQLKGLIKTITLISNNFKGPEVLSGKAALAVELSDVLIMPKGKGEDVT